MSIYALVYQARYTANFISLRHAKTMQTLCSKTSRDNFFELFSQVHLCYLKPNHICNMFCSALHLARLAALLVCLFVSRYLVCLFFFKPVFSFFLHSIVYASFLTLVRISSFYHHVSLCLVNSLSIRDSCL